MEVRTGASVVGGWKLSENKIPLLSQEGKAREARRGGSIAEMFRDGNHPSHDLPSCCPPDSGGQFDLTPILQLAQFTSPSAGNS